MSACLYGGACLVALRLALMGSDVSNLGRTPQIGSVAAGADVPAPSPAEFVPASSAGHAIAMICACRCSALVTCRVDGHGHVPAKSPKSPAE